MPRYDVGRWGSLPMNGQVSCEGPVGKTSLATTPPPAEIEADRFNGEVDPKSVGVHMGYI